MSEMTRDSWWQRNWKWFVPVGCLGVLALIAASVLMIVFLVMGGMRNAEVTQLAISTAQAHPGLVRAIGEPITPRGFISGNISISGPSGEADLAIPVAGSHGRATLYGEAQRRQGQWHYQSLVAEVEGDGPRLDLLEPEN
ncbi:MAG: hypothetical protein EA370_08520 [Wenzhouxiangella sp.]|nr:MAG: hypothetical protein EA370_08520 [Wenzhouxiangella sp.]